MMKSATAKSTGKLKVNKRDYPLKRGNKYYITDGKEELAYPSVTTILGETIPKPGLLYWAAKVVGEYALEHPEASLEECRAQMNITKNAAADKGKTVHSWCEAYGNGHLLDPETLPEELKPYGRAFVAFMNEHRPKILHTECVIFNKTHGYAGTADLLAYTQDGKLAIFDYKTGKDTYFESHLQQEAYANGEFIYTKNREIIEMPKVESKYLVHLKPNGTFSLIQVDEPFSSFLTVIQMWKVLKKVE